jgi:L-lysine exporter family protein LysE/ArgO
VNPLLAGLLVALLMTLGIGPSLLLYFQATIQRGFIAGLAVLSGIWVSDIGFVFVNYLGISQIFNTVPHQRIAATISASVLLVLGSMQWIRKPAPVGCPNFPPPEAPRLQHSRGFLSGFIVNSSNPLLLAYWMTLIGMTGANFGFRTDSFYSFLAGIFLGEVLCDTAKCFAFSRIRVRVNPLLAAWINRIAGSAMMVAAIAIVCKSFVR